MTTKPAAQGAGRTPLGQVVGKCSHYEDGARWCDFCGCRLDIGSPLETKHDPGCQVGAVVNSFDGLLAAARAAEPILHWANCHGSRCDEVIDQLRAAIAAAEGGE